MKRRTAALFCILILLVVNLFSCTKSIPKIDLRGATIVPSSMMEGAASAFLFIINDGNGSDILAGCSIKDHPSIRGELHDVVGGKMTQVSETKVPPRQTVELKRGGLHLMFFDVPEDFPETVTIVMSFQTSGMVEVEAAFNRQ